MEQRQNAYPSETVTSAEFPSPASFPQPEFSEGPEAPALFAKGWSEAIN